MKRIILVITTLALACGLMLGSIGSVMASTTQSGEGRGLFGTVESVDISDNATGTGVITLSNVKPSECYRKCHDRGDSGHRQHRVSHSYRHHCPEVADVGGSSRARARDWWRTPTEWRYCSPILPATASPRRS